VGQSVNNVAAILGLNAYDYVAVVVMQVDRYSHRTCLLKWKLRSTSAQTRTCMTVPQTNPGQNPPPTEFPR